MRSSKVRGERDEDQQATRRRILEPAGVVNISSRIMIRMNDEQQQQDEKPASSSHQPPD